MSRIKGMKKSQLKKLIKETIHELLGGLDDRELETVKNIAREIYGGFKNVKFHGEKHGEKFYIVTLDNTGSQRWIKSNRSGWFNQPKIQSTTHNKYWDPVDKHLTREQLGYSHTSIDRIPEKNPKY